MDPTLPTPAADERSRMLLLQVFAACLGASLANQPASCREAAAAHAALLLRQACACLKLDDEVYAGNLPFLDMALALADITPLVDGLCLVVTADEASAAEATAAAASELPVVRSSVSAAEASAAEAATTASELTVVPASASPASAPSSARLAASVMVLMGTFIQAAGTYDARTRQVLLLLARAMGLTAAQFTRQEHAFAVTWLRDLEHAAAMEAEAARAAEAASAGTKKKQQSRWKRWRKRVLIGGAAIVGGALVAVTGGLALPAVAGGVVALGGAVGLGAAAGATAVFLSSTAGLVVATAVFGATGAGLVGYRTSRRMSSCTDFRFARLTVGGVEGAAVCRVAVDDDEDCGGGGGSGGGGGGRGRARRPSRDTRGTTRTPAAVAGSAAASADSTAVLAGSDSGCSVTASTESAESAALAELAEFEVYLSALYESDNTPHLTSPDEYGGASAAGLVEGVAGVGGGVDDRCVPGTASSGGSGGEAKDGTELGGAGGGGGCGEGGDSSAETVLSQVAARGEESDDSSDVDAEEGGEGKEGKEGKKKGSETAATVAAAAAAAAPPGSLTACIVVSGWLDSGDAEGDASTKNWEYSLHKHWGCLLAPPENASSFGGPLNPLDETFQLHWERAELTRLGSALNTLGGKQAASFAATQALKQTALSSLMAAVTWPAALLNLGSLIDNPWSVACGRADETGEALADALCAGAHGHRPVTLVGYSMGARVIFSCLKALARRAQEDDVGAGGGAGGGGGGDSGKAQKGGGAEEKAGASANRGGKAGKAGKAGSKAGGAGGGNAPARGTAGTGAAGTGEGGRSGTSARGIVQHVVLLGAPISTEAASWEHARSVVSGFLVNGYNRGDWILPFAFRASNWVATGRGLGVAGVVPVNVDGIFNVDLSARLDTHTHYRTRLGLALTHVQLACGRAFLEDPVAPRETRKGDRNPSKSRP